MTQATTGALATQLEDFINRFVRRIAPLEEATAQAWWNLNTTGEDRYEQEMVASIVAYSTAFLEPGEYELVEGWYAQRDEIGDPLLLRQLEILRRMFVENQLPRDYIERIAAFEAEMEATYNNYRGQVDGQELNDNEIVDALKGETDLERRKKVWEASKQIGAAVEPRLLELVALRNEAARMQGFRDFYARSLYLQEIEEDELFAILDKLEEATREPFALVKGELDRQIAVRFGISSAELRPWHYADPFFQEAPAAPDADLDALFADADIEALTRKTYTGIGLEIGDIMDRSDLYERAGKSQHAFCVSIGRTPEGVRVLCNLRPTSRWMSTNLHEFGHAIYDKYLDSELPWLLRSIAHISTTEAIAMLMGRLALDKAWIAGVLGKDPAEVAAQEQAARSEQRLSMLIFVRWALVVVHFERALYRDPEKTDLNTLWWDLVEKFQGVQRPDGRTAPDWAAKIHIATTPVYYHNYILGELTASQLQDALAREGGIVMNKDAGSYLRDRLFRLGARYPWNAALKSVTGESLNPQHFVDQFVVTD